MDGIWSKLKRDSQYQFKKVQDWATHLVYPQSILLEFDNAGAPKESYLIRFVREGLKPLIQAQIKQRGQKLDSWTKIVKKSVDAKAKASFLPIAFIRDIDSRVPHGNRPNANRASTQAPAMKDPRVEEPKTRPQEATQPRTPTKNSKRSRKKKDRQSGRDRRPQEGSTPATGVNAAKPYTAAKAHQPQTGRAY